jgi:hypothetical protein
MTEDRKNRIKRMIASAAMMEGVVLSLEASLSQDPAIAQKVKANPEFFGRAVDLLLDRLAPYFDSMDDSSIAQATAYQESRAGQESARCMMGLQQQMGSVAAEWMLQVQELIAKLP